MATAGYNLRIGVYGLSPANAIVIPTVWAKAGKIKDSASPDDESFAPATPELVAQIMSASETALSIAQGVAAAAERGDFDGEDGFSPTASVTRDNGVTTIEITDENGTTRAQVYDGENGDPGVYIGTGTPEEGTQIWVNPDGTQSVMVPTMDDLDELGNVDSTRAAADAIALKHGYYRAINFDYTWESGSIHYPSGTNKNPDVNVIRIALPRIQFSSNITFIVTNTFYRVRFYAFRDAGGATGYQQGNWRTAVGVYTENIDPDSYYRIQIATQIGHPMDMYEALSSIVIVSEADKIASAFDPLWDNYIESRVQLINSYLRDGSKKTAFLFLTDTHWNGSIAQLNSYGINPGLMKYVADRCNIQYLIHGGDLNCEYRSNINIARECMTRPVSMMRDAFEHVLLTRGNHDDNNESGYRDASLTITQADSYSYMFRNTKDVVFGETGTYFYHDIPFEKVRIISLDGIDFPYTSTDGVIDEKLLAYGHTQLQWLCDTLASTPADYHVVIYTHEMLAPSIVTVEHPSDSPQTRARNYLILVNILKAYKNRQNYSETMSGSFSVHPEYYTGTLSGDFRAATAHIVGVFSGHEHVDCIEEILDASNNGIGIYNTCTQNSSNLFGSTVLSSTYQHPMAIGTTTELVWDVVVIDRENKHVDMIRIGAGGANTDVAEVNVRSFDYV